MIRTDQYKHFFICFGVSALGTIPWQIWHEGWMLALPVALSDLLADGLGIAIAFWIVGV